MLLHDAGNLNTSTRYSIINVYHSLPPEMEPDVKTSIERMDATAESAVAKVKQLESILAALNKRATRPKKLPYVRLTSTKGDVRMFKRVYHKRFVLNKLDVESGETPRTEAELFRVRDTWVLNAAQLLANEGVSPTVANLMAIGVSSGMVHDAKKRCDAEQNREVLARFQELSAKAASKPRDDVAAAKVLFDGMVQLHAEYGLLGNTELFWPQMEKYFYLDTADFPAAADMTEDAQVFTRWIKCLEKTPGGDFVTAIPWRVTKTVIVTDHMPQSQPSIASLGGIPCSDPHNSNTPAGHNILRD